MSKAKQAKMEILAVPEQDRGDFVLNRYKERIDYYWAASTRNKNAYKWTRVLIIILGALVTLITSISGVQNPPTPDKAYFHPLLAPSVAALLTILGGFSQNFQWGAAWREMVLAAMALERIYDKLRVTPVHQRNYEAELDELYDLVLEEGHGFFDRLIGVSAKANPKNTPASKPESKPKEGKKGVDSESAAPEKEDPSASVAADVTQITDKPKVTG